MTALPFLAWAAVALLAAPGAGVLPSGPQWHRIASTTVPIGDQVGRPVWDRADQELVLVTQTFTGPNGAPVAHTWIYRDGRWQAPRVLTPDFEFATMVYDAADGYLLYSGVCWVAFEPCATPPAAETWTFVRGGWHHLHPAVSPPPRFFPGFAYDSALGEAVLFGGSDINDRTLDDTWTFTAGSWTQVRTVHHPPARVDPGMGYDPATGAVVLSGGTAGSPGVPVIFGDVWTFGGRDWTRLVAHSSPPASIGPLIAYDFRLHGLLLVTGPLATTSRETWLLRNATWTNEGENAPETAFALSYAGGALNESVLAVSGPLVRSTHDPTTVLWTFG